MSKSKDILSAILGILMYIYLAISSIMFFFFLYQYSQSHSFARTMIIGWISSTWKAFLWVFYI